MKKSKNIIQPTAFEKQFYALLRMRYGSSVLWFSAFIASIALILIIASSLWNTQQNQLWSTESQRVEHPAAGSQKSETQLPVCPGASMTEDECLWSCEHDLHGVCTASLKGQQGIQCYTCELGGAQRDATHCVSGETRAQCEQHCEGTCRENSSNEDGLQCFSCSGSGVGHCTAPAVSQRDCLKTCSGDCVTVSILANDVHCQICKETAVVQTCPPGTIETRERCEQACQNGTCTEKQGIDSASCFSCVLCPEGSQASEELCTETCKGTCTVVAKEGELSCWRCISDCGETCQEYGFDPPATDYEEYVRGIVESRNCVSGVSVQKKTAQIGSCACAIQPTVTILEDVPLCQETVCGDIACGQEKQCVDEGNNVVDLSCVWDGWRKLGAYQYQAAIRLE